MKKQSAKSQKRKEQKKEDAGARKGGKFTKYFIFSWFYGSGGLKTRFAKAAGTKITGEIRDEKLHTRCGAKPISKWKNIKYLRIEILLEAEILKKRTALWREVHLEVKCVKNCGVRSSFGSWDDEKMHGVVARSTFPSQNVQNTPGSEPFWQLRCRKITRGCGAKYISKWKYTKYHMFTTFLEVQISFPVTGARNYTPFQKWSKLNVFFGIFKNDGNNGDIWKGITKMHFRWQAHFKI